MRRQSPNRSAVRQGVDLLPLLEESPGATVPELLGSRSKLLRPPTPLVIFQSLIVVPSFYVVWQWLSERLGKSKNPIPAVGAAPGAPHSHAS